MQPITYSHTHTATHTHVHAHCLYILPGRSSTDFYCWWQFSSSGACGGAVDKWAAVVILSNVLSASTRFTKLLVTAASSEARQKYVQSERCKSKFSIFKYSLTTPWVLCRISQTKKRQWFWEKTKKVLCRCIQWWCHRKNTSKNKVKMFLPLFSPLSSPPFYLFTAAEGCTLWVWICHRFPPVTKVLLTVWSLLVFLYNCAPHHDLLWHDNICLRSAIPFRGRQSRSSASISPYLPPPVQPLTDHLQMLIYDFCIIKNLCLFCFILIHWNMKTSVPLNRWWKQATISVQHPFFPTCSLIQQPLSYIKAIRKTVTFAKSSTGQGSGVWVLRVSVITAVFWTACL